MRNNLKWHVCRVPRAPKLRRAESPRGRALPPRHPGLHCTLKTRCRLHQLKDSKAMKPLSPRAPGPGLFPGFRLLQHHLSGSTRIARAPVEFGVSIARAAQTVSVVILGVAFSTLIFGRLADMYPVKPLILMGGAVVSGAGLACALVQDIDILILLRLAQGLFIPALTTCIATYLARTLPVHRLNVVMGSMSRPRLLADWAASPGR